DLAWSGANLIAVSIPAPSDNNPLNNAEKQKISYKFLENNEKGCKWFDISQHYASRRARRDE
ncbi:MAG: hypothetical protein OXF00_11380, partial [bacterium]|nr:hypothetical protein [bacterium]